MMLVMKKGFKNGVLLMRRNLLNGNYNEKHGNSRLLAFINLKYFSVIFVLKANKIFLFNVLFCEEN